MLATSPGSIAPAVGLPTGRITSLRRWNLGLGLLHAIQAVAILALATAFALPVTASFLQGPPGTPAGAPTTLVDVPIAWASRSSSSSRPASIGSSRRLASSGAMSPGSRRTTTTTGGPSTRSPRR